MAEYIEREAAVLSLLDKGQHSRRYKLGEIWELDFEEIREAINSIPAADVRPVRHGRWIDTDNYYMRWKCSECGNHTRDARPPYCPNCGAKMDGGTT